MKRPCGLLVLCLSILVAGWEAPAEAEVIHVPDDESEIHLALLSAGTTDEVQVNARAKPYQGFTMVSGIYVYAADGETPVIDPGDSLTTAVEWPDDAALGTTLKGFTIRGGTSTVAHVQGQGWILDCTIENAGDPQPRTGILAEDYAIIDGCTVTMSGDQINTGIEQSSGHAYIKNCTVIDEGTELSTGIAASTVSSPRGQIDDCEVTMKQGVGIDALEFIIVSDCVVRINENDSGNRGILCSDGGWADSLKVTRCFVKAHGGVGIQTKNFTYGGNYSDTFEISHCTVDSVDTGIWGDSSDPSVRNCIVTNQRDTGGSGYGYKSVDPEYCIGFGSGAFEGSYDGTNKL